MLREINIALIKVNIIRVEGMVVFTLSIKDFAESTAIADSFHFSVENHLRIIFCKHKD